MASAFLYMNESKLFHLLAYSMVQNPLERFNRQLIRVSLSNSILVILIFY